MVETSDVITDVHPVFLSSLNISAIRTLFMFGLCSWIATLVKGSITIFFALIFSAAAKIGPNIE
jgi:hypothetical protein